MAIVGVMESPSGRLICHVDQAVDPVAALRVAESLAVRLSQQLLLVVAPPRPSPVPGLPDDARERLVRAEAEEALAAAAGVLEGEVPRIHRIEPGDAGRRLAALAAEEQARLVVVSSGGHGPLLARLLGRPHVELATVSPCPVVVVPASLCVHERLGGPIVCGVDGSDQSLGAARFAADLAQALTARLLLVHVAPAARAHAPGWIGRDQDVPLQSQAPSSTRALERAFSVLPPGLEAGFAIERGGPAAQLLGVASRCGAELIVVGPRGVGALMSALFGSVSAELVAEAPVPVVIVPSASTSNRLPVSPDDGRERRVAGRNDG